MRRLLASAAGAALFLGCISNASDTAPEFRPRDLHFQVQGIDCYAYGVTEYKEKKLYSYAFFDSAKSAAKAYHEGKSALEEALGKDVSGPQIRDKPDPWPYTCAVGVFAPPEYDWLGGGLGELKDNAYVLFMKTKPPVLVYRLEVFKPEVQVFD